MKPQAQPSAPLQNVLARLEKVARCGEGYVALCPAHADLQPSLSIAEGEGGRVLLHCHAGCELPEICEALGIGVHALFPTRRTGAGGDMSPPESGATAQPKAVAGCCVAEYAKAKRLPAEFLVTTAGLSNVNLSGTLAVSMPYSDAAGGEVAVRFRMALRGDNRFRWRKGAKLVLYGLARLEAARVAGAVVIVEGESDCHTLWYHGIPALGLPGANNWKEDRDAPHLDGIGTIYVLIEPDKGGESVMKWLSTSRIRERVRLVRLDGFKDPSAMHVADPAQFKARWEAAVRKAQPWADRAAADVVAKREAAWAQCGELATTPKILGSFVADLRRCGVVGEARAAKVIFLALVSRLLDRPVSLAIKGPSSAGKSFLAENVLKFFPPTAFYALSAMSDRALAYSDEPLAHRFLVIYEAAGLSGEIATYLIRSLLSEGCVRYETVEKTKDGLRPRLIQRDGPTGLLLTTTALTLHPENETRFFSISVTDTPDQTRNVMLEMAREGRAQPDFTRWHALQSWLECGEHRVSVPFGETLAGMIPTVAVRLRRDFAAVLGLVRAHAILHQANRRRDAAGRIIATLEDYAAVRELLADTLAEGLDRAVSKEVRETVKAVEALRPEPSTPLGLTLRVVRLKDVAEYLKLDKGSTSRRVRKALRGGFLKNLEEKRGKEMRLVLGDPLPADVEVLPTVEALQRSCTVARESGTFLTPPATGAVVRRERKLE